MPDDKQAVTLNQDQRLYVIPHVYRGKVTGYSCLGFEVCDERRRALEAELAPFGYKYGDGTIETAPGTINAYVRYQLAVAEASRLNVRTGWRSQSELTPQLIGLEGKRVEVIDAYGERRRFTVGKSMGFIPCHLEIKTKRSTGGGAVTGAPFRSVAVVASR